MRRIERWRINETRESVIVNMTETCYSLFVDMKNRLYCSLTDDHRIVRQSLDTINSRMDTIAGTGCSGSHVDHLNRPRGIYVDQNFSLYVADCLNDRVQKFFEDDTIGKTVAGNGTSAQFYLNCPTSVLLDGQGYIFLVDSYNHRVIAESALGFRCILGCSGYGTATNQLLFPQSMAFDSQGNIYLSDYGNTRLRKFLRLNQSQSNESD